MTPFPEARDLVLSHVEPLGTETVPLHLLGGRTFAQRLICPFDVPHFDNSQVDGYALRAEDEGPRRIVGESAAGGGLPPPVGPGEAVRIFTGARMPEGADAVAMQEDCTLESGGEKVVTIAVPIETGDSIRRRGEEIAEGTTFDVAGRLATPPLVGLAASFGLTDFEVCRRPSAWIVGTGSELVRPGKPLPDGGVYASNPEALASGLEAMGISALTHLVRDDPATMARSLAGILEASDVLITVGGVSVGDHDLVRPTLARLGVEELLWRVAMKPGKPFYFGKKGGKVVIGLPGNPVSALVTFAVLVRPALRRMLGLKDTEEETTTRLGAAIMRKDLRYEFVRATLRDGVATPVEAQGSHMQTGLAFADALIHVPDGVASLAAGAAVTITPLRWGLV